MKPIGAAFLREAVSPPRDCLVQDVRIHWTVISMANPRRLVEELTLRPCSRSTGPPTIRNWQLGFLLAPIDFLTRGELLEAVDQLVARGFVKRVGPRGVWINPIAVRVVPRPELPARLLMKGNASRASRGGNPPRPVADGFVSESGQRLSTVLGNT
ncbi:hypothetical protein ACGFWI_37265 [Streptomyces sp. NPDC048434]|uniref:hypothetical protein n=1 Tax=Streptomyces sp. NPDC048434 TaxID=3365549 RepID=UPI0037145BB9